MFKCICRKIPNSVRNSRAKRELFVRTVAPVYRLMIKMFDQLKNSWHDLLIADWMAGYFKSRHQVYVFSSLVLMGINLAKRQTPFLTLGRTRGGGGGNCQTL